MRRLLLTLALLTHALAALRTSRVDAEEFGPLTNTEKASTAPMAPDEVCKTAKLPPGFKLRVFAAEPDVQNPIAITTDERGRLWVAENYSWTGADGFTAEQRDRIVILEDVDGDGTRDRRVVFLDNARKLTSIEVGNGGVWAICLPHLVFIPDNNRDDAPDGPAVVVLDGLQENNIAHTPANGLKWGPDGWLYARHGILGTSQIGKPDASDSQRVAINTGVWRYHPVRGKVEAVLHGMTNSWGFDFDEHGEMFVINTVIGHLWHVLPGAHVQRMFGVDINPHAYQLIEQTADHVHWDTGESWDDIREGVTDKTSAAGGGHAHIGLMIYQGDNWPKQYRGHVYTLNLHGLRINCDHLVRDGASYTATHGPDMCFVADPWFRGMDLITGPDGGVFIADWSDTGECHDEDGVHRTSGRIYKLTYGKPQRLKPFDLAGKSDHELVQLLLHPNCWWQRQARRLLTERSQANDVAKSSIATTRAELLQLLDEQREVGPRLRVLETLCAITDAGEEWLMERCAAPDEYERASAMRFLIDRLSDESQTPSNDMLALLERSAENDPSGLVLLRLTTALQKIPHQQRWPIARALAARKEFADDRTFPLMLWYGIEPAVPASPALALQLAAQSQSPLLTQNIARRLTLEIQRDPPIAEKLLDLAISGEAVHSREILVGMSLALHGWRKAPCPANWSQAANAFGKSDDSELTQIVRELGVVFGDGLALDELRSIAADAAAEPEARRQALRALLSSKPADFVPTLLGLLQDPAMAAEAIRGLALYDEPEIPTQILDNLNAFSATERKETIAALASRPNYALALLEAIRDRRIAPSEVSAFYARQIRSFEDEQLTARLIELWGDVAVTADEKRSQIDAYKSSLTAASLAEANLSAGRATYQKTCANCHVLFGVGRKLGPDLTGSNRQNIDYLLENIVDPSATVGVDFRASLVLLADGRALSGVISAENERTITLETANETVTIDRSDVEELQPTAASPMPDGLLQNLTAEETRDLIGYLMSTSQAPLPN